MSKLTETFTNIFKIQELRERIFFTAALLIVVRLGSHITLPGVDARVLADYMQKANQGSLFGLYDLFVGGAFSNAAVFALGIMPYISASIVIQLLGAVVPYFQKLQKEGEDGRKKITQYTRYGTVLISLLQASGVVIKLESTITPQGAIVPAAVAGFGFALSTVVILTAGTIFMMWLGEQITERGIGNGISLIIFIGIIARFPNSLLDEYQLIVAGRNIIIELVILAMMGFIVAGVVLVTQGTRRIPVQYAKRVIGRKVYGGVTQYIPLRVNTAGVMPIIFAQAIMFVPQIVFQFFPESEFIDTLNRDWFSWDSWSYSIIYGLMIVFFTYFYTAIAFNPKDVADNMKKQGGFIPGIRPGTHTADFVDNILTKITLPGSIFLAIVAILPTVMSKIGGVTPGFAQFFGGTSLLIIVGVALDTLQQVESHLLMRHYDGFMKSGKLRGRRS
ncbi:MAG TPA: preprotein translocase subunit SecY [Bacteroidetes bacterium]|nr:MAG: preprotein translocase subunit SecY [Ignavibacteria bacterium GWA2_54_16]HCA81968.1 preprotein translocase subunit SecY [Bacteroidota bacterium]